MLGALVARLHVAAAGDRLRVTLSPSARMAAMGMTEETMDMVPLDGGTYIATTAPNGVYPTITFVDG